MSSVDFSEAKIETTHAAAPEETLGFEDVNSLILGSQALLECLLKGQDEHFDLWGEALEALIDKGEKLTPFNQMCHLLHDWKDRPYKNDFKKMLAAEILPLAAPCFEEDPTQTLSGLIKGFAWARHMGISALWIDKILDLTTPSSSTDPQATFVACCAALAWSEKDSAREIRATKFFNAATDRLFARFPHEAFGLLCQELRQASNHLRLKPAMEEKFLFYASAAAKDSPLKALQTMVQESQHLSPSDFFNLFEARFIATGQDAIRQNPKESFQRIGEDLARAQPKTYHEKMLASVFNRMADLSVQQNSVEAFHLLCERIPDSSLLKKYLSLNPPKREFVEKILKHAEACAQLDPDLALKGLHRARPWTSKDSEERKKANRLLAKLKKDCRLTPSLTQSLLSIVTGGLGSGPA